MPNLTLQRRVGESVILTMADGRIIRVTPTFIRDRQRVRLTFNAPDDVVISRPELGAVFHKRVQPKEVTET